MARHTDKAQARKAREDLKARLKAQKKAPRLARRKQKEQKEGKV